MKLGYCYKSDRAEETPYNLSVDKETAELLENWALIQLRRVLYGKDKMNEPEPEAIKEAYATYQKLVDLLKE